MHTHNQKGAASLFIVIFTMLLLTVVTVGFAQIMVRNQEQTQAADLSQSAYDAALAGVEDAKRVLVHLTSCDTATPPADCAAVTAAVDDKQCNTTIASGIADVVANTESEVQVGDGSLNQSYTCVKVDRFPTVYPVRLTPQSPSSVTPIRPSSGTGTKLRISWFTRDDVSPTGTTPVLSTGIQTPLVKLNQWNTNTPPVLRAQYIPGSVSNDLLDSQGQTVFAYPRQVGGPAVQDSRRSGTFTVSAAKCVTDYAVASLGVCSIDIDGLNLPTGVTSYVQLSGIYVTRAVSANIQLFDSNNVVLPLSGIATVDATGKTADRFRRVVAQVKISAASNRPQPRAALDLTGNVCKTFLLTNSSSDYNAGNCDPAAN
jgi:Tfp pilus assembly protein PilX